MRNHSPTHSLTPKRLKQGQLSASWGSYLSLSIVCLKTPVRWSEYVASQLLNFDPRPIFRLRYLRTCSKERIRKFRLSLRRRANGAKKRHAAGNHKVTGIRLEMSGYRQSLSWPHVNWPVQVPWPMAAPTSTPVRLYAHKCYPARSAGL